MLILCLFFTVCLLSGQGHGRVLTQEETFEGFPVEEADKIQKLSEKYTQKAIAINLDWGGEGYDFLTGNYTNELGSTMDLQWNGLYLVGSYQSAVGNAVGSYWLYGSASSCWEDGATVGFCVAWINTENGNSNATTCWTGHMLVNNGKTQLIMTWVLSMKPKDRKQMWKSNQIGQDIFSKH
jgi:hypothetical protein